MKISHQAQRSARQLFDASLVDGRLNEARSLMIAETIISSKPRYAFSILKEFTRLTRLELGYHHAVIESAVPLEPASQAAMVAALKSRDDQVTVSTTITPSLLGGVRVQLGSSVWDGTISTKLEKLKNS